MIKIYIALALARSSMKFSWHRAARLKVKWNCRAGDGSWHSIIDIALCSISPKQKCAIAFEIYSNTCSWMSASRCHFIFIGSAELTQGFNWKNVQMSVSTVDGTKKVRWISTMITIKKSSSAGAVSISGCWALIKSNVEHEKMCTKD